MTENKPQNSHLEIEPEIERLSNIVIRQSFSTDGASVNALIANCPPLDQNSLYCNLLQCTHFSATSALAEQNNKVLGFVSGYRLPDEPDTLFIWQVAVDPIARGKALGKQLILDILARPVCADVSMLKTTVTSPNAASRAMFEKIAAALDAPHQRTLLFDRDRHLGGQHDSEFLISIGPFRTLGRKNQTGEKNHDHT